MSAPDDLIKATDDDMAASHALRRAIGEALAPLVGAGGITALHMHVLMERPGGLLPFTVHMALNEECQACLVDFMAGGIGEPQPAETIAIDIPKRN